MQRDVIPTYRSVSHYPRPNGFWCGVFPYNPLYVTTGLYPWRTYLDRACLSKGPFGVAN